MSAGFYFGEMLISHFHDVNRLHTVTFSFRVQMRLRFHVNA